MAREEKVEGSKMKSSSSQTDIAQALNLEDLKIDKPENAESQDKNLTKSSSYEILTESPDVSTPTTLKQQASDPLALKSFK